MVKHTSTIRRQKPANCLSVSDHFVGLALKELIQFTINNLNPFIHNVWQFFNITHEEVKLSQYSTAVSEVFWKVYTNNSVGLKCDLKFDIKLNTC